jgi:hypothetical protein
MPKRQYTVKEFNGGIVTAQPASDLSKNQYAFGYDIDPSYPGGLKGRQADNSWKDGIGSAGKISTRAELNTNYQALISGSSVYLYQDLDPNGIAYTLGTVGSNVSMEANNKTIHIGTGNTQNNVPKWLGIVSHTQFGNLPTNDVEVFNAPIDPPQATQGFSFGLGWKGCSDNNGGFVYIDKAGKRLTRFTSTSPYYDKTSGDIFQNITALCGDPEVPGDILVYDNKTSTIHRVDAGSMTIKSTTELSFQNAENGYVITDIETTNNDVYLARVAIGGSTDVKESQRAGTSKNELGKQEVPTSFLYRISKSNLSGVANLTDASPKFDNAKDLYALNTTLNTYVLVSSLDSYKMSLRLGTKCLFRVDSTRIGVYGNITIQGTLGENVISQSLYIQYADPPSPLYREVSSGSLVIVSNGQGTMLVGRNNVHAFDGTFPDTVVWLSYTGTTLHRAYHQNNGGQNVYGSSTVTLTNTITPGALSFSTNNVATNLVKNAAMVFNGSAYFMLNGDGTLDPAARFASTPNNALTSSLGTLYLTEEPNGFTESDTTYYYKFSYLYDGFQESPLTSTESFISTNAGKKIKIAIFVPSTVNRRVSHINLYRAQSGGINGLAKSFYQLVESISLAPAAAEVTTSFGSTSVTGRKFEFIDNFTLNQLGPTFESNAGLPETITTSKVHYGLACQQGGYHFVADCWHPVLGAEVKQYIFRSAQGQFDTFNYFSSFLRLPETPVALVSFKSRIFAFSKSRMWRINPDGFYIEDEMNGFGALSPTAIVTTDFGMFFAGPNGIYVSDGGAPTDIAFPINKTYSGETFSSINPAWSNRDTTKQVSLNYDPRNRQLIVAYWPQGATTYHFLVYSFDQRRWDLWSGTTFGASVSAPGVTSDGVPTFWSTGGTVRTLATSTTGMGTTYYSPYFDLEEPGIEKWIYNVKLQLRDALPTTVTLEIDNETPISLTNPVLEEGTALPSSGKDAIYRYDVPQANSEYRRGKRFRIAIVSPVNCKIDSIDFTYREKMFKGGL